MGTRLMSAAKIAEQLGTSRTYAYKVICKHNAELAKRGCLIVQGKVSRCASKSDISLAGLCPLSTKERTMSVSKDPERGTFYVQCRYKDWTGRSKKKAKHGFKAGKDARK